MEDPTFNGVLDICREDDFEEVKSHARTVRPKQIEMVEADRRVCVCTGDKKIVELGALDLPDNEIDRVYEYYCTTCNSFWREA